jgi:hypothetical protein
MALAFVKGAIFTMVTVVASICIYHYFIRPMMYLPGFSNPGGPRHLYLKATNTSAFEEYNITKKDSLIFYQKVYPKLENWVDSSLPREVYRPYYWQDGRLIKAQKIIAECATRIVQFKLMNKQTNSSGKIMYFIHAKVENAVIPNDSIIKNYHDDLIQLDIGIACDSEYKTIIAVHDDGAAWNYLGFQNCTEETHTALMQHYLQELVFDYHFYYDLPILNIRNPAFWDSVFNSKYNEWNNEIIYPIKPPPPINFRDSHLITKESSGVLEFTPKSGK